MDSNALFAVALVAMIVMGVAALYRGIRSNDVHLQISGWALLLFAGLPIFFLAWRWLRRFRFSAGVFLFMLTLLQSLASNL